MYALFYLSSVIETLEKLIRNKFVGSNYFDSNCIDVCLFDLCAVTLRDGLRS